LTVERQLWVIFDILDGLAERPFFPRKRPAGTVEKCHLHPKCASAKWRLVGVTATQQK
jgi:hypothetical protein